MNALMQTEQVISLCSCLWWSLVASWPTSSSAAASCSLTGGFIQYPVSLANLEGLDWQTILADMRAAGMSHVILQDLVAETANGTLHSFMNPKGSKDATESILDYADLHGMKVTIGLVSYQANGDEASMTSEFLSSATRRGTVGALHEIHDRYLIGQHHPSFEGWYVPLEVWTRRFSNSEITSLKSFYGKVASE